MEISRKQESIPVGQVDAHSESRSPVGLKRKIAMFLFMGAVFAAAQQNQQPGPPPTNGSSPPTDPGPGRGWTTSGQLAIPVPQAGQPNFEAANAERRKQIADDSARLLKLATDLKAEVDKTTKDTLSLNVIRKADEIEKLAHSVKDKMRLTAGTN
jgi:hypothetical protein